jgi:hypothetical protein
MATKVISKISGGTESPTPVTTTGYKEEAAAVLKLIEAVQAAVPAQEVPVGLKLNTPFAMVKEQFLASAAGMFDNSAELQLFQGPDMGAVRDALQYADAFRPVMEKLMTAIRHIQLQIRYRKVQASAAALQVYNLAKGVSQATPGVQFDSHLKSLKSQVTSPRKKAVKASTAATPASTPAGTTPTPPAAKPTV